MKNCLILLTNYYPFFKGEEYLESEILHLSTIFRKIYILSTMADEEMEQTRSLPNNITVIKSGIPHSISGKIKMVLAKQKAARYSIKNNQLLKKDGENSILKKAFSFYFESRAKYIYSRLLKKLERENITDKKFDNIVIYSYWFYITARIAVELKQNYFKNFNPYTISRAHGYDINEHVNLLKFIPQRKFLLNSLDNVYPVSQYSVDFLRKKYPEYKNKVEVRRLGTKKMNITTHNKSDVVNIVSCSTIRKLKRIDLIIEALAILKEKKINFKWTHIGSGPDFENVKKLAVEKLDSDQFEFTGYMKNSEVLDWYQDNKYTVFINTSSSEGVPVSIMEAMSMSLPVIATDVGGTKEIVESDVTGYLLKSNCSKEEVADCLIKILYMDEVKYNEMCESAYRLWNNQCNADKLYSAFANELHLANSKV